MARTVLMCALLVALAGCGGSAQSSTLQVVASTNVYGDIARQVGGKDVTVTSILTDPNSDPHLFEPGTANGLAVAHAGLVIQNGLGYDSFMSRLMVAAPSSHRVVVTVADSLDVHGKDANPHLWYDVEASGRIAGAIASGLDTADKLHTNAYAARLQRFVLSLGPLFRAVDAIRAQHQGTAVAYTESVPGYLLENAGLRNLAPASFTRPIAEGTEPSPAAVSAMEDLVRKRRIAVLLYNAQAVSPITQRILAAATKAGIPVVGVTETLPPGLTFQQWQLRQIKALARALQS